MSKMPQALQPLSKYSQGIPWHSKLWRQWGQSCVWSWRRKMKVRSKTNDFQLVSNWILNESPEIPDRGGWDFDIPGLPLEKYLLDCDYSYSGANWLEWYCSLAPLKNVYLLLVKIKQTDVPVSVQPWNMHSLFSGLSPLCDCQTSGCSSVFDKTTQGLKGWGRRSRSADGAQNDSSTHKAQLMRFPTSSITKRFCSQTTTHTLRPYTDCPQKAVLFKDNHTHTKTLHWLSAQSDSLHRQPHTH